VNPQSPINVEQRRLYETNGHEAPETINTNIKYSAEIKFRVGDVETSLKVTSDDRERLIPMLEQALIVADTYQLQPNLTDE
jgi:hypothetical protein